jgi:AcrR family transcriptional regulator
MTIATDHRPRVNAERRAKMRRRLIEAAMLVVADKGFETTQIDDVMKAAGVSRGGFYGHFRSMPELLGAIGAELGNETMQLIEERVTGIADPAERIATGLLLYLSFAQTYPHFARFIAAAGANVNNPHNLVYEYLPPHIAAGNAAGRFDTPMSEVAVDLIAGAMLVALMRVATGQGQSDYCVGVIAGILMGLGLPKGVSRKLAAKQVNPIVPPAESLLMRSHLRHLASPIPEPLDVP